MKKESNSNKVLKVVGVVGASLALVGASIGLGFVLDQAEPVTKIVTVDKIVEKEVIVEKNVTVEVPYNVTVIEEVDNGNLDMVLSYLEDKDIFDDAEDIVRDIEREDLALKIAIDEIKDEFADELEDRGIVEDEDDVSIVKIYSDLDEYEILSADYDDEEFLFKIEVKIDDDERDDKFKVEFIVEVEDGSAKIKKVYAPKSVMPVQ